MPKHRLNRINEEMKKELSDVIRTQIKDPRVSAMTTIVAVEVTPDLRFAKTYISILGSDEDKEETLKGLNSASGFIRREVGSRLQLRHTPEIHFELDKSIEHGSNIMKILNDIKKQGGGETI